MASLRSLCAASRRQAAAEVGAEGYDEQRLAGGDGVAAEATYTLITRGEVAEAVVLFAA